MDTGKVTPLFDPGTDCRAKPCDNAVRCLCEGECCYRSSGEQAMERMTVGVDLAAPGSDRAGFHYVGGGTSIITDEPKLVATSKATNPKDAIGSDKLPLHLWPATATALGCLGLLDGMLKYGRSNFREIGVRASIYVDAAKRHLDAYFEGEDADPDSGLSHLAHALACIAIIVDADAAGKLNDDRMVQGGYRKLVAKLTPHVKRLKALHASKHPKHYTIADSR